MTRDFWKDGFTEADCVPAIRLDGYVGEPMLTLAQANAILKAELEKAVEVFGLDAGYPVGWSASQRRSTIDTHSAKLVRVEELGK